VTAAFATAYTMRKVDNDAIWDALLNAGVTHYAGAPTVQIGIVNHPKAKKLPRVVRVAVAASAPTAQLLGMMESLNLVPVHVYGVSQRTSYAPRNVCKLMPSRTAHGDLRPRHAAIHGANMGCYVDRGAGTADGAARARLPDLCVCQFRNASPHC
jgi:hypothetical protein